MGGTQSLHTNSRDEALALPTAEAVQIALRTQQIIANESGVGDTVDPLAGSYYIEHLTDELEKQAQDYIKSIDEMGGMLAAIEAGYVQREIQEAAYRFQRDLEENQAIIVGVNRFTSLELEQCERLAELRRQRDNNRVAELRSHLATAASCPENLLPLFITCVENNVTLGEICDTLRDVWGEYRPGFTL
jgi:methylmalonyl-CoA mutase N-terminal domain/subunit